MTAEVLDKTAQRMTQLRFRVDIEQTKGLAVWCSFENLFENTLGL